MRVPAAPLALFVGAALLHWGAGLPARREAARAEAERARVAAEGDGLRARVQRAERRRAAEQSVRRAAPPASSDPIVALRRSMLETLRSAPVKDVRLTVGPASAPLAARARLTVDGRFADLATLSARLLAADRGLLPEELLWRPNDARTTLDMSAVALARAP